MSRPARLAAALTLAAITGCAAQPPGMQRVQPTAPPGPPGPHLVLQNAGFESAPRPGERCPVRWACVMHADPDSYHFTVEGDGSAEGRQHLCIVHRKNEPWAVISQPLFDAALAGRTVRLSLSMRADGLTGNGAGPWLLAQGPGPERLHDERLARTTRGWERMSLEARVPPGMHTLEVGATLQGPGRVCFDDVRLELLEDRTR